MYEVPCTLVHLWYFDRRSKTILVVLAVVWVRDHHEFLCLWNDLMRSPSSIFEYFKTSLL
jgi:hypothetical protein